MTAETVRAALTPRTKAVIAVHLFGNLAPVAEIEALGVPVLKDAAQAAGSRGRQRAGRARHAATFSFFPSKNLGCFGDGGVITTADDGSPNAARTLRFHGSHDKVTYEQVGYNSRLDELQAAILRVQLPHLDAWADGRRRAGGTTSTPGSASSWRCPPAAGARARMAPLRGRAPRRRAPRTRADSGRHRPQALLPHPRAPPAGDAPVGAPASSCPGTEQRGPHPPRDPDEPRAQPRAGRAGRRRCAPADVRAYALAAL